jgi:proteic killer suppression protein
VIKSFRRKGLKELFTTGRSAKVPSTLRVRCDQILHLLDEAENLNDLAIPGPRRRHPIESPRHALDVNGPWRITFEFVAPDAWRVDLEQYH